MTPELQALKSFLENKEKAETLFYPAFNAWGQGREYFKKFGIDPLWDMVVDPTRYPFDLGYGWGTFKIIRDKNLHEYLSLLNEACLSVS